MHTGSIVVALIQYSFATGSILIPSHLNGSIGSIGSIGSLNLLAPPIGSLILVGVLDPMWNTYVPSMASNLVFVAGHHVCDKR